MKKTAKRLRAFLLAGVGTLVLTGLSVTAALTPYEHLDQRHCALAHAPATTLAVALDISDPLVVAEPRQVSFSIGQVLASLKKGDRVVALDVAGKPAAEISLLVDQCLPGDDDNIARNAFRRAIVEPIADHLRDVTGHAASAESPLAETMVSLVTDPSVHPLGSKLVVFLVTDGIQNSPLQSAFRRGSQFPKPQGEPLKGVVIKLLLIRNDRDIALQPRAVARLTSWLRAAGAQVVAPEPGWLTLAQSEYRGGKR